MQYTPEQELLRRTFLAEATELAAGFKENPDILAAFLTGSAAWGKPNPDGDLDILLITKNNQGVFYRYLLPKFSQVPRRTEFGFLPMALVQEKIERAYGDAISCSTIEQFKNGRILFQKDDQGERVVRACRHSAPGRLLIGRKINDINGLIKKLKQALEEKQNQTVVLTARRIMSLSSRLLLLVRDRLGVAKEKQEYRAITKIFDKTESTSYETIMNIGDSDREKAYRAILDTIELVGGILSKRRVSDKIVRYNGFHRQTAS